MARLTHPNGATVEVADDRVDELLGRGFTAEKSAPAKEAVAKKAAAKRK